MTSGHLRSFRAPQPHRWNNSQVWVVDWFSEFSHGFTHRCDWFGDSPFINDFPFLDLFLFFCQCFLHAPPRPQLHAWDYFSQDQLLWGPKMRIFLAENEWEDKLTQGSWKKDYVTLNENILDGKWMSVVLKCFTTENQSEFGNCLTVSI